MIRKVFKRLPTERFRNFLTTYKINPNYFTISRRFVSKAVLIGLFLALLPIPFRFIIILLLATITRFNIVIALSIVMLANPITIPFVVFIEYQLGSSLLQSDAHMHMQFSWQWVQDNYEQIFLPLFIGSLTLATLISLLSYFLIEMLWIQSAKKAYKARKSL